MTSIAFATAIAPSWTTEPAVASLTEAAPPFVGTTLQVGVPVNVASMAPDGLNPPPDTE